MKPRPVSRRHWLGGLASFAIGLEAALAAAVTRLRGRLTQVKEGEPGELTLPRGRTVRLKGDAPTIGVLGDPRLKDTDFEVEGEASGPGEFEIRPIHTRSLFVYQEGKRLMVTYWCEICYIRTFTPGECWCCQEWTKLDLRDPDAPEPKP